MRKLRDMECRKNIYIVESKIKKKYIKWYFSTINDAKKRKLITNRDYRELKKRYNERWICDGALSFSKDYKSILKEYKTTIKSNPWQKYRIVRANCIYHRDHGISMTDVNYEIIKVLRPKVKFIFYTITQRILSVKSVFNSIRVKKYWKEFINVYHATN